MAKLKSRITKIISSILGFFGIMTFTSCYGAVMMYGVLPNYNVVSGSVEGDVDGDGELENVSGIRVIFKSQSPVSEPSESDGPIRTLTDDEGNYTIIQDPPKKGDYIIEFIDEDGAENGEFETYSENITFTGEEEYEEQIVNPKLKRKTAE